LPFRPANLQTLACPTEFSLGWGGEREQTLDYQNGFPRILPRADMPKRLKINSSIYFIETKKI
jgi:hypothetical protein